MRCLFVATVLLVLAPAVAVADAIVIVRLNPAVAGREATVVLRNADGQVGSCRTREATCTIRGVPAGRYEVFARADDGRETAPRQLMLPADGEVRLVVAAP